MWCGEIARRNSAASALRFDIVAVETPAPLLALSSVFTLSERGFRGSGRQQVANASASEFRCAASVLESFAETVSVVFSIRPCMGCAANGLGRQVCVAVRRIWLQMAAIR